MRRAFLPRLVLALACSVLAACSGAPGDAPPSAAAPAPASGPAPARTERPLDARSSRTARCPARDFDGFVQAFADDIALQRAFTARPLRMQRVDATAQPEPAAIVTQLDDAAIDYPLMPSRTERERRGLRLDVVESPTPVARLVQPDTDHQVEFEFRRGDCWTLVAVRDDSL